MYIGKVLSDILPKTTLLDAIPAIPISIATGNGTTLAGTVPIQDVAASIFYVLTLFLAIVMWSFGLVWLFFAIFSLYVNMPLPFNMGWWGFTFPIGVYTACTIQIGLELPSPVFRMLGTVSLH
jgi:tellurite resistance protein TehA-like permease